MGIPNKLGGHYLIWLGRDDAGRLLGLAAFATLFTFIAALLLIDLFTSPPVGRKLYLMLLGYLWWLLVVGGTWKLAARCYRSTIEFLVIDFEDSTCTVAHATGMKLNAVERFAISDCSYDIGGATVTSALSPLVRRQAYCLTFAIQRRPICVLATRWTFEDIAALPRSLQPSLSVFTTEEIRALNGEWSLSGRIYRFDPLLTAEPAAGKWALRLARWNQEGLLTRIRAQEATSDNA